MNQTSRRMFALIGAAALSVSACGTDSAAGEDGAQVLRISGLMPLTGAVADTYGASMIGGVQYVIDQVNADGGVEINGERYEIDFEVLQVRRGTEDLRPAQERVEAEEAGAPPAPVPEPEPTPPAASPTDASP